MILLHEFFRIRTELIIDMISKFAENKESNREKRVKNASSSCNPLGSRMGRGQIGRTQNGEPKRAVLERTTRTETALSYRDYNRIDSNRLKS